MTDISGCTSSKPNEPYFIPVYIGYDRREDIAYKVCQQSLDCERALINPLIQDSLRAADLYTRPVDKLASTDFSLTRFMVPQLQNFRGWAMFCDCDFLFTKSIEQLWAMRDQSKAVMVVKHDYIPKGYELFKTNTKMDNQRQFLYPCKNWSSLILWNCDHPANRSLTAAAVNRHNAKWLHRFGWLKREEIGELPREWNWLVGEYGIAEETPAALHYTLGGPWFEEHQDCDYADLWKSKREEIR